MAADADVYAAKLRRRLAVNVKRARQTLQLSQRKLSEGSGLSQSQVSHVEAGNLNLTLASLARLSSAVQLTLPMLFEDAPDPAHD